MKKIFRQLESLHVTLAWGLFEFRVDLATKNKDDQDSKDAIGFFVSGEEEDED